jgi:hypothetical protein
MDNGWVLLHRKLFENKLWTAEPFTKGQAWIDIFANANHQDGSFWVRGNEVMVKRGQIGWSELTMCKRWGWSKNKTRRFLKWLETEQQIKQQKTFITTIITVLNFEKYQKTIQQKDSRNRQNDTADDTADDTAENAIKFNNDKVNINNDIKNGTTNGLVDDFSKSKNDTQTKNDIKQRNKTRADKPLKDKFETDKYPKENYIKALNEYQRLKGIKLQGDEFLPIMAELKRIFKAGRLVEQIIETMGICEENYEDWSMNTVRMKIADVVGGKLRGKDKTKPLILLGAKDI